MRSKAKLSWSNVRQSMLIRAYLRGNTCYFEKQLFGDILCVEILDIMYNYAEQ